jgi:hypothetical protein
MLIETWVETRELPTTAKALSRCSMSTKPEMVLLDIRHARELDGNEDLTTDSSRDVLGQTGGGWWR